MVSGAEAADSVCKIARKWGITRKGISPAEVLVLGSSENYHGLTTGIWPLMDASNQAGDIPKLSCLLAPADDSRIRCDKQEHNQS